MENLEKIFRNIVKTENTILLNQVKELLKTAGAKEPEPELMDFNQCKAFLMCSDSYLYKKTSTNEIPHIKHGKKLFFERSKLLKWLQDSRVKTVAEIEAATDEFLYNNKKRRV